MELYTLDALLRRVELIEDFESFIWTDRYKQHGDFEVHIYSTRRARVLLKEETLLATDVSPYVMKVESVEAKEDANNKRVLVVKGRSLEALLYDRVAKESLSDLTTSPKWTIADMTPTAIARKIFHDICVTGILSTYDQIPFINEGSLSSSPSNIAEPVDLVTVEIEPTTVYDAISQLADVWNFGFRMVREGDMSRLWFDVYMGADRTTGQSVFPAVVFTPELENLQNTTELTVTEGAKNVAYVYSPAGFQMVYASGVDPDVEGFDRRVLTVKADDITLDLEEGETPTTEQLEAIEAALIRRGMDELSKARTYQAFDGEISQFSQYKPGRDYNLGDLVEMRNIDGVTNEMRITEIIYVSDSEGERSYPTLTLNQFINTGSWRSAGGKMWSEMLDEEWVDMP